MDIAPEGILDIYQTIEQHHKITKTIWEKCKSAPKTLGDNDLKDVVENNRQLSAWRHRIAYSCISTEFYKWNNMRDISTVMMEECTSRQNQTGYFAWSPISEFYETNRKLTIRIALLKGEKRAIELALYLKALQGGYHTLESLNDRQEDNLQEEERDKFIAQYSSWAKEYIAEEEKMRANLKANARKAGFPLYFEIDPNAASEKVKYPATVPPEIETVKTVNKKLLQKIKNNNSFMDYTRSLGILECLKKEQNEESTTEDQEGLQILRACSSKMTYNLLIEGTEFKTLLDGATVLKQGIERFRAINSALNTEIENFNNAECVRFAEREKEAHDHAEALLKLLEEEQAQEALKIKKSIKSNQRNKKNHRNTTTTKLPRNPSKQQQTQKIPQVPNLKPEQKSKSTIVGSPPPSDTSVSCKTQHTPAAQNHKTSKKHSKRNRGTGEKRKNITPNKQASNQTKSLEKLENLEKSQRQDTTQPQNDQLDTVSVTQVLNDILNEEANMLNVSTTSEHQLSNSILKPQHNTFLENTTVKILKREDTNIPGALPTAPSQDNNWQENADHQETKKPESEHTLNFVNLITDINEKNNITDTNESIQPKPAREQPQTKIKKFKKWISHTKKGEETKDKEKLTSADNLVPHPAHLNSAMAYHSTSIPHYQTPCLVPSTHITYGLTHGGPVTIVEQFFGRAMATHVIHPDAEYVGSLYNQLRCKYKYLKSVIHMFTNHPPNIAQFLNDTPRYMPRNNQVPIIHHGGATGYQEIHVLTEKMNWMEDFLRKNGLEQDEDGKWQKYKG